MSTPSGSFYLMVVISGTIASYGLLTNSTAVVIGAMLVAPLMGPIFGIALGLTIGDRPLLAKALVSEVLGVVLVAGIGAAIGLVPLRADFGGEILARTQPTLYDMVIALAAGLAGAYSMAREELSPALPGVAIAVALVPPLATCGLCVAAAEWSLALGAFLLFLANFLAIQVAAAAVLTAFGMVEVGTREFATFGDFVRHFSISLVALAAIGVFMTHTLVQVIGDRRFRSDVEETLAQEVQSTVGAQLADVRYQQSDGATEVVAAVLTPLQFEPRDVARMQTALRQRTRPDVRLIVRSLLSKDCDGRGVVYVASETGVAAEAISPDRQFLQQATDVLGESLKEVPGAQLADVRRDQRPDRDVLTAYVRTPAAIDPEHVARAEQAIINSTGKPVRLIVRSIITHDADAERQLYEPPGEGPAPLTGDALKLHERLQGAVANQLSRAVEGAGLAEVRYTDEDQRLRVQAVARTPSVVEPEQVRDIEAALRRYVDARIDLTVRSEVGADVTASGYVTDGSAETRSPAPASVE